MASRTGSKSHKSHHNLSSVRQQANSAGSSTTSSSKQFLETTSADGLSSPASSSARSKPPQQFYSDAAAVELQRPKEDVTVTVRFRPLSPKEIRQGEEIAWYADGDTIVRNEHNPSIAYAYDRVFGPTTTTRHVYDIAAQYVIGGAMEGINGTIFAYGVTSSGKTHTMHGDQRSPGIIPLAVKDAFSIIQETPTREFLLRVSYLEIYNEVVNDLLNPAGQNLRIREDAQGTFVEGIKEEVVLSPAHALSLIAAGHEHRHVGSTNFNIQSSRSHTIFTLTIESSPTECCEGEAVKLSQLNLIDLAGSESSKAETTGVRRKEGSYINKSLLTLGTVISKLTDGKGSHVPYRDSKLTRLLQSSLGGHGRVSLICNLTPSSSNTEETHNTLKFAHRAKHIEVQAAQNKIIDEKSLIKKYQHEIRCLKEELEHLKRGIVTDPQIKLEEVRLQSRLGEEEEAKAALMARIQRLSKLILVSSKSTQISRFSQRPGPRRRHSFGEEELAYLPHKRRDLIWDDENLDLYISVDGNAESPTETFKEEKKTKKNGLLNWLKPRKRDSGMGTLSASEKSSGAKSTSTPSTPQAESVNIRPESRFSLASESTPSAEHLAEAIHDREVAEGNFLARETPLTSMTSIDQIDLLREQQKILLGEVALHKSSLKRLSEDLTRQPKKGRIQDEIVKLNDQIKSKNEQIDLLQKQIADSLLTSDENLEILEESQPLDELVAQLNEKSFELEVKVADNRIIQEQLNERIHECRELEKTVASLKQQLSDALEQKNAGTGGTDNMKESLALQAQEMEIRELRRKVHQLTEAKEQLELRNQKLAEESSYAKGLASAAAVELKALSEEVAKLMTQNERLTSDLSAQKSSPAQRRNLTPTTRNGRRESLVKPSPPTNELKRELALSREREHSYEAALHEKEEREAELQSIVEESKQREAYLENELANMWVLVAKLRKSQGGGSEESEAAKDEQRSIIDMWNGST